MDLKPISRELRKLGLDAKIDKESPIPALMFKHLGLTSQLSFIISDQTAEPYDGILFQAPCPNPCGLDEVDANDFNSEYQFVTMCVDEAGVLFSRLYPFSASQVTSSLFLEMVKLWVSQHTLMRTTVLGE